MILALEYLHSKKVVYRDLKPENVVLDLEGNACLTDFGIAKFIQHDLENSKIVGTAEYIAPEVFTTKVYSTASDWWSLGILM